jgi:hypothetical protein
MASTADDGQTEERQTTDKRRTRRAAAVQQQRALVIATASGGSSICTAEDGEDGWSSGRRMAKTEGRTNEWTNDGPEGGVRSSVQMTAAGWRRGQEVRMEDVTPEFVFLSFSPFSLLFDTEEITGGRCHI